MRKIMFMMLMMAGVLTLFSARASSMCVYNKLTGNPATITVFFFCGGFCSNTWKLNPGDKACRSKTGGQLQACFPNADVHSCSSDSPTDPNCYVNVLDNGWVDLVGTCHGTNCDQDFACNVHR